MPRSTITTASGAVITTAPGTPSFSPSAEGATITGTINIAELPLDAIEEMSLAFSDGTVAPVERMGSSFHAPAPTVQGVVPVALQFRMKPPAPPAPADG